MGFGDYNIQQGNGRKEKLGDIKHGVRKEQLDSKYKALFDAYDANKDGTLEAEELDNIFKGLQSFAGSDNVLDANENAQVKSIFAEQVNIQDVDFQGFVKSVSDASATIFSSSEKQTPDGGKEVTTTYNDGTVETISYYPDGEFKFKKIVKNSVTVLSETQKTNASQALGNTPTVTVVASKKARAKIPNIENAIKELIEDGAAAADVAKKYKIDKNKLLEYYNSLLAPVSDDMLTFYGDEATFKKLRKYVANNAEITVATLNNENPEQQVTIVSHKTKNGNFYRAYDKYGDAITTKDLHDVFGITDVRATEDGAFRFVTDNSESVKISQAATRQGNAVVYSTTLKDYLNTQAPQVSVAVSKKVGPVEFSQRAQAEIEIKQAILQHFVDSRQEVQEYLKSMGILDDIGASINVVFGGNILELLKKYQNTASQALRLNAAKSQMDADNSLYLNDFKETTGLNASTEACTKFYNTIMQYQNATILKDRIEILDKAMLEINAYQDDVKLQKQVGRQAQGLNTENHIANAKALLLQYFSGDQKAVNMLVDNNQPEAVIETIKGIKADTDKQYQSVLAGKKYDDVKADYQNQYKAIYGTDFVPDELTEKVMVAKATGSFVKLAAITIVSILITRSPAMAQINGAIAGSAEATGAAANLMRTLVARYGQTAVAQGVKFAMTSGTLATDVGLTLLNQVTSERGFNGEELWESTKASAKFIYFGSYVGGPLAQAVSQRLGKIGVTAKMFKGGAKSANGAMQTTTIAGDKLMQNLVKGGNQILTKGGAFLTDVAAFTGLEVVTDGADLLAAGKEQLEFLPKLKIMNGIIEYVLGGRVHAGMVKAKMDAAIEQSGVKNWTIKEIKTPTKTMYEVEVAKGMPKARFANSNDLATAMLEAVAGKYEKLFNAAKGEGSKNDTSTKIEASPKPTSPQAAPQDKEVQGGNEKKVEQVAPFAERLLKSPTVEDLTNPQVKTVKLENGEFNEHGEFVSDGTYTKAETPYSKKQETYRIYSDGDKKLATTVEELALQFAHYCGREKAVESDIYAVKALLRGKDVTPQDVSEIILDFNHATEGREYFNEGILSWRGLQTVKDLKTFKANIKEFDKFMTELKANNTDSDVLHSLRNLRMDFISENLSSIKPEEFKKNLETFKNFDSNLQSGCMRADSNWCMKVHTQAEFNNLEVTNEYNKWASVKIAEGKNGVPYFTYDAFKLANRSPEEFAQVKKNIELVKEMVESASTNLHLMIKILTDSYDTSLYTDLNVKIKAELGHKYNAKDFDKIFLSAYYDRGNYNFDFGIQLAKNYPNGFKHFGAYQISKMAEKFAKLDKSAQEDMVAKITILGKFPKLGEQNNNVSEWLFDKFMSNDIPDAKNIADYINKSTEDSFKSFNFERSYGLEDIQNFIKARQVGESFDKNYTDTLLATNLGISLSQKAKILELAKIDKEFVNELLASKKGYKDCKPVYFRDEAVMNKFEGKTTETKLEQELNYDYIGNEYTAEDMKFLVEAKNIDENLTRELMSATINGDYALSRRFTPEQINKIVKLAQFDKSFANELINDTVPSYRGTEVYRLDSEAICAVMENISTCKDFMKEIINAKNNDKSSFNYGKYEYNSSDITNLAKAAKIDAEYTRELLNTYEEGYRNQIYKRFYSEDILNIITAGQNNKALMKELVNSSKEHPYDKIHDVVYNAQGIVQILNFEKSIEDKAFVKDIFADIEFKQNSLARVAIILNNRRNQELNSMFKELFYDREFPNDSIPGIIESLNSDNIALLRKLKVNPDYPKNRIASVLQVTTEYNIELAEQLCTDKNFPKDYITDILVKVSSTNKDIALKLCSNKKIPAEHISTILRYTNNSNLDAVVAFCENYKQYGISAERIVEFVPCLNHINLDNMKALRNKFGDDIYQKLSANDFVLLTNNMEVIGKTSVDSLLKSEKYDLINVLLTNKSLICEGKLSNIKEVAPIIPANETEYAMRMKELSDGLNIVFDKLTSEKQVIFDHSIASLNKGVQGMNLADLSEINLKYSQKEFVNDINELLKDLPLEDQIKLQNKFGFRIIDDKLTGYPKNVKDVNTIEFEDKTLLNNINKKIDSFLNNNALTVKDNPQLNSLLNNLFKNCPEILNQIDGTPEFANTVKRLQAIANSKEFKALSDSDKKIIVLAALFENTDKSINTSKIAAFDAFFIGQKYGLSDNEAKKLYYIVEAGFCVETFMQTTKDTTVRRYRTSQITGQDRQDKFDMMALNLKEDNRLQMAQMLYSSKYPEGFTRNFDKALENRVNEIKSQDFILPQTPSETYQNYATAAEISRGNNKYNVNIVNAKDVPNMYAFVHTPEAGYATGGTRAANFSNFEAFATLNDDKVICTSYVSADKAGLVKEFGKGFIFEVQNDKQYIAYGRDIYSLGKNIQDIVVEYYRDKGFKAAQNKGAKYDHRTLMSNIMKQMLFGKDYYQMSNNVITTIYHIKAKYDSELQGLKTQRQNIIKNKFGTDNITNAQYQELKSNADFVNIEKQINDLRKQELAEIENIPEYKELKDMDNKYIARLDNVKAKLGDKPMTLDNIKTIDAELATAYKAFLDRDGTNKSEKLDCSVSLLRSSWHNECLISNPKIIGIFTDNLENLPEEYLRKAQEEKLPIIVF